MVGTDAAVDSTRLRDGCLDVCLEATDVLDRCGCWTCVAGINSCGFYATGFVGCMEGKGYVAGFRSCHIAG